MTVCATDTLASDEPSTGDFGLRGGPMGASRLCFEHSQPRRFADCKNQRSAPKNTILNARERLRRLLTRSLRHPLRPNGHQATRAHERAIYLFLTIATQDRATNIQGGGHKMAKRNKRLAWRAGGRASGALVEGTSHGCLDGRVTAEEHKEYGARNKGNCIVGGGGWETSCSRLRGFLT
ncbi:hypothetical protein K458DRAFT_93381 [Lentithecium fluviatile CBS 122367]|uniref:Uncharacterized protein n=1 Tax=Lentithecium fluviatile CBS 122367 TaxID=1168545 RepID=A0A6G1IQC2_9PLEO|nr:hypothetical protein K458DRAFT_93381 [Lentithecium fluviatile CBS 122367]